MLRLGFVVSANDEGLIERNGDDKTVEQYGVNKSMIEIETMISNPVFNVRRFYVLNYLRSAILYTKIKKPKKYVEIFTSC